MSGGANPPRPLSSAALAEGLRAAAERRTEFQLPASVQAAAELRQAGLREEVAQARKARKERLAQVGPLQDYVGINDTIKIGEEVIIRDVNWNSNGDRYSDVVDEKKQTIKKTYKAYINNYEDRNSRKTFVFIMVCFYLAYIYFLTIIEFNEETSDEMMYMYKNASGITFDFFNMYYESDTIYNVDDKGSINMNVNETLFNASQLFHGGEYSHFMGGDGSSLGNGDGFTSFKQLFGSGDNVSTFASDAKVWSLHDNSLKSGINFIDNIDKKVINPGTARRNQYLKLFNSPKFSDKNGSYLSLVDLYDSNDPNASYIANLGTCKPIQNVNSISCSLCSNASYVCKQLNSIDYTKNELYKILKLNEICNPRRLITIKSKVPGESLEIDTKLCKELENIYGSYYSIQSPFNADNTTDTTYFRELPKNQRIPEYMKDKGNKDTIAYKVDQCINSKIFSKNKAYIFIIFDKQPPGNNDATIQSVHLYQNKQDAQFIKLVPGYFQLSTPTQKSNGIQEEILGETQGVTQGETQGETQGVTQGETQGVTQGETPWIKLIIVLVIIVFLILLFRFLCEWCLKKRVGQINKDKFDEYKNLGFELEQFSHVDNNPLYNNKLEP